MHALYTAALSFPEFSPALVEIDLGFLGLGSFPIRWYALAYIAGLIIEHLESQVRPLARVREPASRKRR